MSFPTPNWGPSSIFSSSKPSNKSAPSSSSSSSSSSSHPPSSSSSSSSKPNVKSSSRPTTDAHKKPTSSSITENNSHRGKKKLELVNPFENEEDEEEKRRKKTTLGPATNTVNKPLGGTPIPTKTTSRPIAVYFGKGKLDHVEQTILSDKDPRYLASVDAIANYVSTKSTKTKPVEPRVLPVSPVAPVSKKSSLLAHEVFPLLSGAQLSTFGPTNVLPVILNPDSQKLVELEASTSCVRKNLLESMRCSFELSEALQEVLEKRLEQERSLTAKNVELLTLHEKLFVVALDMLNSSRATLALSEENKIAQSKRKTESVEAPVETKRQRLNVREIGNFDFSDIAAHELDLLDNGLEEANSAFVRSTRFKDTLNVENGQSI